MRMYNEEVFNDFVQGTTEVFTAAKWNPILGQMEKGVLQLWVTQISGSGPPTITLTSYGSADGKTWNSIDVIKNGTSLSANILGEMDSVLGNNTGPLAFIRFGILLGGTAPAAQVRIKVCARAQHSKMTPFTE